MPFVELKTNVKLTDEVKKELSRELGKEIELIRKTESWLMLNFIDNQSMYFKGNDLPCVIAEVKLYGEVDSRLADRFTSALTDTISNLTNIPANRIYVNYFGTDNWGYSGSNF